MLHCGNPLQSGRDIVAGVQGREVATGLSISLVQQYLDLISQHAMILINHP